MRKLATKDELTRISKLTFKLIAKKGNSASKELREPTHNPMFQITEARAQNSKNALARRALAARVRANP